MITINEQVNYEVNQSIKDQFCVNQEPKFPANLSIILSIRHDNFHSPRHTKAYCTLRYSTTPSICKEPNLPPKFPPIQSFNISDRTLAEGKKLIPARKGRSQQREKADEGKDGAKATCPGNNKNRWWIDSIRYRRKRRSVRQQIIITIIFQKSGQQTIGSVIGNGRVSISPVSQPSSLSLLLIFSLSLSLSRTFPASSSWIEGLGRGLRSGSPGQPTQRAERALEQ